MTAHETRDAARRVLDVGRFPNHAFGHQGLIWWGTVGFMVIEGSMFVVALVTYLFLRTRVAEWPPSVLAPDATFGTINLLVLLVSGIPNHRAKAAAERFDLPRVRWLMLVCLAFGIVFVGIRVIEFSALGVRWDTNAYGSIVWFTMGIHTTHLVTDVADTAVLTALMFTRHVEPKRFVDVSENALYWDFVVASWLPIYAAVYLAPHVL